MDIFFYNIKLQLIIGEIILVKINEINKLWCTIYTKSCMCCYLNNIYI